MRGVAFHDEDVNYENHMVLNMDTLELVTKETSDTTDQEEGLEKQSDLPAYHEYDEVRNLDSGTLTQLHRAGYLLDVETISTVLSTNLDAVTALHWAAKSGYFWELKYLLDRGVNACAIDNVDGSRKRAALHYAARGGFAREVDVLIAKGADVKALDADSRSPLDYAARGGFRRISEALLKAGASVHSLNSLMETPLHCAARDGHFDVIELLLAWGADKWAEDAEGNTPFARARKASRTIEALRIPEVKKGRTWKTRNGWMRKMPHTMTMTGRVRSYGV